MLTKDLRQVEQSIPRFAILFRAIKIPAWAKEHGLQKGDLLYRPLYGTHGFISLEDNRMNWHLGASHVKALAYINLNNLKRDFEIRPLPRTGVPKEGGVKFLSNFSALRAELKELLS